MIRVYFCTSLLIFFYLLFCLLFFFFFFHDTAPTEIYTLSLHDALPILLHLGAVLPNLSFAADAHYHHLADDIIRSEEHTSELQSRLHLVCRLLLEKKKNNTESIAKTKCTTHSSVLSILSHLSSSPPMIS